MFKHSESRVIGLKKPMPLFLAGLILVSWAVGVFAAESWEVPELNNILAVKKIVATHSDWREIYGEVVAIFPSSLHLRVDGRVYVFPISKDAIFYCNGYPCERKALQPVSQRAYFEALVYINTNGALCLANGTYNGTEAIIRSYRVDQGELKVVLYQPEENRLGEYWICKSAQLPQDPKWLQPETAVYVLYNYKQEIRAVFSSGEH